MIEKRPVSVVIPAYNEEQSVGKVIDAYRDGLTAYYGRADGFEIIVVDDGSKDATAAAARSHGATVIQHKTNHGYGATLKLGINHARFEDVLITDADDTYRVEEAIKVLDARDGSDMAVGARVGRTVKIPLVRRPAKWALLKLASYLSGEDIPDINSGLRLFKRDDIKNYFHIVSNGFSFTMTTTLSYLADGKDVVFVPINYHARTGHSKIRPIRDTLLFLQVILRTIIYFNPLRVFLPISLLLFLFGLGVATYEVIVHHNLTDLSLISIIAGIQVGATGLLADLIVRKKGR
ncbi:MAG: glycosyltransferase family 2 protein [Acidobacteriota bacterium]